MGMILAKRADDSMEAYLGPGCHPMQDDLEELRAEALKRLAMMAIALSIGLLGLGVVSTRVSVPEMWVVVFALSGPAVVCWWLIRRSPIGASAILYAGLVASIIGAAVIYSSPTVLYALPLAMSVTPLLIGYRGTCILAVVTGLVVWTAHALGISPIVDADVLAIGVLMALGLLLSWIAFRPISTTIDWAWAGYQGERRKTEEVRLRQAELAQMSKSLTEACERLEQVNLELSDARRAAEDARCLKDQFVTTISHELRTPLNLIIGFSDLIVNGPAMTATAEVLPATFRRDLETIYRNACHLSTLVDDVLDLGRLEAHRLAMRKEWCRFPPVLEEAINSVSALYERAGLCLTTSLPEDLPALYIDATRIRQVLINLLANAVRYVEDGSVSVTARRDGGDVVVSVADTGVGIPLDDLPYVFEPFRQTGQLHRRGGFGLGLTVSKQFVEMHGGSMWAESKPNHGTTFQFSLPMTDNVAAAAPGSGVHKYGGGRPNGPADRTILLLDRDVESARVFERYLDGYKIVTATSALEVARLGRKERISSVVVVNGSEPSTEDLVQIALRDHPPVPVVRCVLRTKTSAGRDLGAAAFLSKPVSRQEISATLRHLKLRPRRILIVDDDLEMLRLLEMTLRTIAPSSLIRTAADGEQGLRVAAEDFGNRLPNVVFLDLLMPNLDGLGFLRLWSADPRLHEIPVVVVSAASEEGHDVITCDSLEIRREGGLGVGEMIHVIRGGLAGLRASSSESTTE
jgi:signal transduction histidine kinase/CheY-like chemotaxis protein